MQSSTHYFVLSLGADCTVLYEAFRDFLIEVENQGFPVLASGTGDDQRRAYMRVVNESLGHHQQDQPLGLIVVGDPLLQAAFDSESKNGTAVVGRIQGDRTGTRTSDLGQIVWPVMKDTISGVIEQALRELKVVAQQGRIRPGLDLVVAAVNGGARGTLLVEDDYHVRGSLAGEIRPGMISPDVDIRDTIDDAVDAVVERVLESGGNAVFMPPGTLRDQDRIVLLLKEESES